MSRPAFLPVSRQRGRCATASDWDEPGTIVTDGRVRPRRADRHRRLARQEPDAGAPRPRSRLPAWRASSSRTRSRGCRRSTRGASQALDGAAASRDGSARARRAPRVRGVSEPPDLAVRVQLDHDLGRPSAPRDGGARSTAKRIIDNVIQHGETPADRFVTDGLDPVGRTAPPSPWMPEDGDLDAAREELDVAETPKERDHAPLRRLRRGTATRRSRCATPGTRSASTTTLRSSPRDTYMDFRGPLGEESVDVYQLNVPLTVPDAGPALDVWTLRVAAEQDELLQRRLRPSDRAGAAGARSGGPNRPLHRGRPRALGDERADAGHPAPVADLHRTSKSLSLPEHVRDRPARAASTWPPCVSTNRAGHRERHKKA